MAEIITNKKTGKKYQHKSLRVDLTPMVDLGFLLITFFILTTSLQKKMVLRLTLPKDTTDSTSIGAERTLTFILRANDSIGYYEGFSKQIDHARFAMMRNVIEQKQKDLTRKNINRTDLIIIIKPTSESTYKNFIDALDEISITDCRHYFIADPTKNEL